jgi:hypothetical protein
MKCATIKALQAGGATSLRAIAKGLNEQGHPDSEGQRPMVRGAGSARAGTHLTRRSN